MCVYVCVLFHRKKEKSAGSNTMCHLEKKACREVEIGFRSEEKCPCQREKGLPARGAEESTDSEENRSGV